MQKIIKKYNKKMRLAVKKEVDKSFRETYINMGCDTSIIATAAWMKDWKYLSCAEAELFINNLPESYEWCRCDDTIINITDDEMLCFSSDDTFMCGKLPN